MNSVSNLSQSDCRQFGIYRITDIAFCCFPFTRVCFHRKPSHSKELWKVSIRRCMASGLPLIPMCEKEAHA